MRFNAVLYCIQSKPVCQTSVFYALFIRNAVPDAVTLIASGKFMDGLSEEQTAVIQEAARKAQEDANAVSDRKAEEAIRYLEEAGMEIVTPSDEDYASMKEMSAPVWDSIRRECGEELFEAYTAGETA
ncbi:MAG: hypothetical protein Q4G47_07020 [Lachnospiraceae bacterium]|nr:hypothetical protein [Lachnospiraceae bacterium]